MSPSMSISASPTAYFSRGKCNVSGRIVVKSEPEFPSPGTFDGRVRYIRPVSMNEILLNESLYNLLWY